MKHQRLSHTPGWKAAPMFPQGDDLPLFSGTAQTAKAHAAMPPEVCASLPLLPDAPITLGDKYQAYTPDTSTDDARRLYVKLHHAEPGRVIRTSGAVLLGPVPAKG